MNCNCNFYTLTLKNTKAYTEYKIATSLSQLLIRLEKWNRLYVILVQQIMI